MKTKFLYLFILYLFFASNVLAQNFTVDNISAINGADIYKYSKFELGFQINTNSGVPLESVVDNIYDEDDIKVECEFYDGNGTLVATRPAFYYKDFCRGSKEGCFGTPNNPANLIPLDTPQPWRVRFAPSIVGRYSCQIKVTINNQSFNSSLYNFNCLESSNPGFVSVASNKRNFKFDNDKMFFPIGENIAWYDGLKPDRCPYNSNINRREYTACVVDYFEEWTDELSQNGGNFTRIMMQSWSWELDKWNNEGTPGVKLGNFDHNQFKAFDLDKIFEMYEDKGIYVIIAVMAPEEFASIHHAGYSWEDNPYHEDQSTLGLQNFQEFFTDNEAKRIFKNKLRYISARWGWSPNLFAYEPFNEVDHIDKAEIDPQETYPEYVEWYDEMARYLKSIDEEHMVSTSCASFWNCLEIYNFNSIDFSKAHNYSSDKYVEYQRNYLTSFMINERVMRKPFFIGEYGYRTGCYSADERQFESHNTLWAHAFSGAGAAPLIWNWESFHNPRWGGYYNYFNTITSFFDDDDIMHSENLEPIGNAQNKSLASLKNLNLAPEFDIKGFTISSSDNIDRKHLSSGISTSNDSGIEVFALKGNELVVGWVHNLQSYWYNSDYDPGGCDFLLIDSNFDNSIPDLNNETLTIDNLNCNGEYKVEWFNTHYDYDGDKEVDHLQTIINTDLPVRFTNNVSAVNGQVTINVPNLKEISPNSYPYAPDYGFKIKLLKDGQNVDCELEYSFDVFPNPLQDDILGIEFTSNIEVIVTIELIDINGHTIDLLENNKPFLAGRSKITKEIKNLPPGMYFIRISSENETQVEKMIKL